MNRSPYLAIYNKVVRSYYFDVKRLEDMDESGLYDRIIGYI